MRPTYTGSFWGLLNPYGLLTGVVSLTMLFMHGAIYLQMRTAGEVQGRAKQAVKIFGIVFWAAFALAGIWQAYGISGLGVQ